MAFGGPKKSGPGGRGKDAKGGDKRRRRRKSSAGASLQVCADKIDDIKQGVKC